MPKVTGALSYRKRTKCATTATAIKNKTVETNLMQMIEYDEHEVLKGI